MQFLGKKSAPKLRARLQERKLLLAPRKYLQNMHNLNSLTGRITRKKAKKQQKNKQSLDLWYFFGWCLALFPSCWLFFVFGFLVCFCLLRVPGLLDSPRSSNEETPKSIMQGWARNPAVDDWSHYHLVIITLSYPMIIQLLQIFQTCLIPL